MSRLMIICFDVADQRRLRKVSRTLEDFGRRVQYSVFECYLDEQDRQALQDKLSTLIDHEADHVRYYELCPKDVPGILIDGRGRLSENSDYHLF